MTLKDLVYKILLENPETRDSDKKLQWEVLEKLNLIDLMGSLSHDNFMKAPEFESVRRCRQSLQRSDLLLGNNLIQPTKEIKQKRVKLSKEKGFRYMECKQIVFNPLTQTYEM